MTKEMAHVHCRENSNRYHNCPTATVESTWFTDATLQVAHLLDRPPTSRHRSAKWTVAPAEQNGSGPTKFGKGRELEHLRPSNPESVPDFAWPSVETRKSPWRDRGGNR